MSPTKRLHAELEEAERIMSSRQLFPLEGRELAEFQRRLGEMLHPKRGGGIRPREDQTQIPV